MDAKLFSLFSSSKAVAILCQQTPSKKQQKKIMGKNKNLFQRKKQL
jgi:hypothetical protein